MAEWFVYKHSAPSGAFHGIFSKNQGITETLDFGENFE
ncbi:MAG: hypothetical protein JETT_3688 [Candidatus Jettenia ecosi]|uniref:Uncharacterized protein n=1 Tax=Candidatus Jettenia ecosi TaxID=2494326 RepID=A0A533QHL1_9BACT|nr:MAG: hypothetical protein JETT_3688 [Candidatus Jettenia ecosi]